MKLTIRERIMLQGCLPPAGTFVTLGLVRKLREALSFTEEEIKDFCIITNDDEGTVSWKREFEADEKDIEIGEKMNDLVVSTLKKLSTEEKLTEQHYSIYEKFVKE